MNDDDLRGAWVTLEPAARQRRRMDARLTRWLEARDTPLAVEWFGLLRNAPFASVGLAAVGATALLTAPPVIWLARALL